MRNITALGLSLVLVGCALTPAPAAARHISKPYTASDQLRIDGAATFRTVVGQRSQIWIEFMSWPSRVMVIDFSSSQNWIDHHTEIEIDAPECSLNQPAREIICLYPYPVTGGLNVEGVAADAGTFHYAIRFSDRASPDMHWVTDPDGSMLTRAWDETVVQR